MKCSALSSRIVAHLVLAAAAKSSDMTNEDDVTDYYDYNYNETMNFDAYTPRKDVTPPSLNLSGLPWEYVADYPEPCFVQALETSFGKIAVGCAKDCLGDDTQQTQILNNCTPCIVMPMDRFKNMTDYDNVSCLLGACEGGNCIGSTNCTWCYKYPVASMVAPN
uniref:Evasin n=1 Tax=Rhipicephalus zambeziensis TaxID=60191 RepID=A0A224Y5U3_9ACAR